MNVTHVGIEKVACCKTPGLGYISLLANIVGSKFQETQENSVRTIVKSNIRRDHCQENSVKTIVKSIVSRHVDKRQEGGGNHGPQRSPVTTMVNPDR